MEVWRKVEEATFFEAPNELAHVFQRDFVVSLSNDVDILETLVLYAAVSWYRQAVVRAWAATHLFRT